jgi:invasion plasmid antigen
MAHGPDTDKLMGFLEFVTNHHATSLDVAYLNITSLPPLPDYLRVLLIGNTNITELTNLPSNLIWLNCCNTKITELPPLPPTLASLECSYTNITELPPLPSTLSLLKCNSSPLILKRNLREPIEDYVKRWEKYHANKRCAAIKEELIAAAWNPRRVEKWIKEYGIEMLDTM